MMKADGAIEIKHIEVLIKVPEHIETEDEFRQFIAKCKADGNPITSTSWDNREIVSFSGDFNG